MGVIKSMISIYLLENNPIPILQDSISALKGVVKFLMMKVINDVKILSGVVV